MRTMPVSGAGTTQTTISGLTPSTTYSIEVAAVNNDLIGQYSTVETALTEGLHSFFLGLHSFTFTVSLSCCSSSDIRDNNSHLYLPLLD